MISTEVSQKEFLFKKNETTTAKEFNVVFTELFHRDWYVQGRKFNLPEAGWKMGYHTKKNSLGTSRQIRGTRTGSVLISKTLLLKNLDKAHKFEDTIRHEIAHAIDTIIRGYSNHDFQWKAIARELGADDSRTYDGALKKPKGKYSAECKKCGTIHERYRRPKRASVCNCVGTWDSDYILDWKQNY
jgi:predicted SprT family Zn-dependent metalloprotease